MQQLNADNLHPQNVTIDHAMVVQNVVDEPQHNLQTVPISVMPNDVRDTLVTGTSMPILDIHKQNETVIEIPPTGNSAEPFAVAHSFAAEVTVPTTQVIIPDIKGKANVPIPHIGSSSEVDTKGNYGSFSLPGSPTLLDLHTLAKDHALQVIDGSHLMSEEGLDLWIQHFAPATQGAAPTFKIENPVSWFNFIIHLLLTPDKFGWTMHLLKSDIWKLLTANCKQEETLLFHIPDGCATSQAPTCKYFTLDLGKENEGISPAAHSSTGAGSPLQQVSPNKALPLGEAISRKRREKEPMVETEVRRSDRIKKDNKSYRRKSCDAKSCLPCHAIPPLIQNLVVKNLTKSFCKVSEDELQDKLSKKPKRRDTRRWLRCARPQEMQPSQGLCDDSTLR